MVNGDDYPDNWAMIDKLGVDAIPTSPGLILEADGTVDITLIGTVSPPPQNSGSRKI